MNTKGFITIGEMLMMTLALLIASILAYTFFNSRDFDSENEPPPPGRTSSITDSEYAEIRVYNKMLNRCLQQCQECFRRLNHCCQGKEK